MNKLVLVAVLLGACTSDDDENKQMNQVDASVQGDAAPSCSAANDTCTGESICNAGACVAAFPRVYRITNVRLMMPTTDPDGAAWDVGGGAPDLKIAIAVNGTVITTTAAVQDQFSATFAGPFDVSLIAGAMLAVNALDEDVSVDDPARPCIANPVTAELLRGREVGCPTQAPFGSVLYRIEPK